MGGNAKEGESLRDMGMTMNIGAAMKAPMAMAMALKRFMARTYPQSLSNPTSRL